MPDSRVDAHLTGIGGAGMSALAQVLLDAGRRVSGSDRQWDRGEQADSLSRLLRQGVRVHPQDGSGLQSAAMLVVSTAIEPDNPDRIRAEVLGIPVCHRAAALAALIPPKRMIAVTGTSGKSTTTAMLGWILAGAGANPVVVNGAVVPTWQSGDRIGAVREGNPDDWWVVEVDESDRSLFRFQPAHAVITNAGPDHFTLAETDAIFNVFGDTVSGIRVDGRHSSVPDHGRQGTWSGTFSFEGHTFRVPMPGTHNLSNAWLAVRMAWSLGFSLDRLADALATFPGLSRRLQRVGRHGKSWVVDDFAHNPDKIRAAWQALANRFPRIAAVWRPHGFAPLRLMSDALFDVFSTVCRPKDRLWILPVYDAGGTADRRVNSVDLVRRLAQHGVPCELAESLDAAAANLRHAAAEGTVLAVMGARDPALSTLALSLVTPS